MDGTDVDQFLPEPPDLSGVRDRLNELDVELGNQRYSARSRNGAAEATVDGHGGLLDIRIDDRALRGGHPELVGQAIVEAVAASRARASEASRPQVHAALASDQPQAAPNPASPPSAPALHGTPEVSRPHSGPPVNNRVPSDDGTSIWRGKASRRRDPDDIENEEPLFGGL
ncbi:YbaB/EbfC family nucleoid-associated protein [Saccharopolyspora sp. 5N708]|uniref:YbaB/EbfC family nucleoid-associated protein n=1 Tax=Saccharopolyspora sp. 5N708 TaxID=3457424 RepID=UPI003FD62FF0